MGTNSRFTVGIHILTLLAHGNRQAMTSDYIAGSVNTNPVVIRRLLSSLREANLVTSQGGPGGGWRLAKPAKTITLRDIYNALEETPLFPMHPNPPNPNCPVGRPIQGLLTTHFDDARASLERQLEKTNVADLVGEVMNSRK